MAGHISLYSSNEDAIREEGSVIYDESAHLTSADIAEVQMQLQQFSSSFSAAYRDIFQIILIQKKIYLILLILVIIWL